MDILNVLEPLLEDESITGYDYRNYFPYNMSQLGNSDEIRVACHNSTFAHLSESCLYLEGSLENWAPETLLRAKLAKNFPLFLFSDVRLELNGQVVDWVRVPGTVGTIRNYCLISKEEKNAATEYFWVDNVNDIAKSMPKFSSCVPLKTVLGLCRDYQKIIVFSQLKLVLVRFRNRADSHLGINSDGVLREPEYRYEQAADLADLALCGSRETPVRHSRPTDRSQEKDG